MKTIRLDVEYPKRLLVADGEPSTPEKVSLAVIIGAINLVYSPQKQRQMTIQELRMWSKIQDRIMDEDGKAISGPVELSDEQFEFVYSKLTEAQYPPNFAVPVTVLVDALEKIKLESVQ
jgi:hypothetical protein